MVAEVNSTHIETLGAISSAIVMMSSGIVGHWANSIPGPTVMGIVCHERHCH